VGDRCYRCRRPVSDVKLAAALVDPGGASFPFRTSGCLSKYLKEHPGEKGIAFVTDNRTGYFLEADKAWFVATALPSPDGRGTEPDYLAFRARTDAERANTTNAPLRRWQAVVASATTN